MDTLAAPLREPSLEEFTAAERKTPVIKWYRTPLPPGEMKSLLERSDLLGATQTLGYLGIYAATATLAIYAAGHFPWWATAAALFLHGMVACFMINAVHELGHGTVFKTKALNHFFTPIVAFLGWHNYEMFTTSHARHHRYTLHPPDDLENVLPIRLVVKDFLRQGFLNYKGAYGTAKNFYRIARGRFEGEWELNLYPPNDPARRVPPVRWAWIALAGHATILAVSLFMHWWIVPVVLTLAPFYGGWLFFLCNNTQHIGLQDNVPDFRACCRTFRLNPLPRFLYWQMNYHTEHHMYAAVPCYRLHRLHQLIRHDLPPCADGLLAVWREIAAIQVIQDEDPTYQHKAVLPMPAARTPVS